MEYSENDSLHFVEWKLNREMALRAHGQHDATGHALFRSAIDFGLEAIRTAALINGGAVLACFAFLGSMRGSTDLQSAKMFQALLGPAFTFAVGALLAGIASGFAYIAQLLYSNAHNEATLTWDAPDFSVDHADKWKTQNWGIHFHVWCVVAVVVSYLCIIIGLYLGWRRLGG